MFGAWNFSGAWRLVLGAFFACVTLAVLAPLDASACATCYSGNIDSPMTDGMNWAILTLGVVVAAVVGGFIAFLIYAIRKSDAVEAARVAALKIKS